MALDVSVIVPTYNRSSILVKCLVALAAQECPHFNWEVLVVDDGSTDETKEVVNRFSRQGGMALQYFRQPNRGPAAARNLGVREAQGDLVLFIGDDIIAIPNLLAEHLAWHEKYLQENVAVLGYVTWSPEIEVTPFMRWLENGGPQFKYLTIKDPENVFWGHLYTANISFKRKFLLENGLFGEDFPYAAYEDTELGYRLDKCGLRIVYNNRAVGYHYHPTTLSDTVARMQRVAESQRIYWEKTGEGSVDNRDSRGRIHRLVSKIKYWLSRQIGCIAERRWIMPGVYSYLLDKAKSEARNG